MQAPKSGMMPLKTGVLYRGTAFRVLQPGRCWEQTCIRFSLGCSGCRRRGRLGARAPAGDDALGLIHGGFVLAFAHILLKANALVAKPVGDLSRASGGGAQRREKCTPTMRWQKNTIKRLYRSLLLHPTPVPGVFQPQIVPGSPIRHNNVFCVWRAMCVCGYAMLL